jgi:hypothetical protein
MLRCASNLTQTLSLSLCLCLSLSLSLSLSAGHAARPQSAGLCARARLPHEQEDGQRCAQGSGPQRRGRHLMGSVSALVDKVILSLSLSRSLSLSFFLSSLLCSRNRPVKVGLDCGNAVVLRFCPKLLTMHQQQRQQHNNHTMHARTHAETPVLLHTNWTRRNAPSCDSGRRFSSTTIQMTLASSNVVSSRRCMRGCSKIRSLCPPVSSVCDAWMCVCVWALCGCVVLVPCTRL